jgi:hypothetical protein
MLGGYLSRRRCSSAVTPAGESLLSGDENLTASAVAQLIADMRVWVHRRVEYGVVVDDVAVVRRSSIDFTVPEELNGVVIGRALRAAGQPFVPITFLAKERLRNFDLRDANGCPLPMLSRRDNGALATTVLVSQAEAVLQRALPAGMRGPLHYVAEKPGAEAQQALAEWHRNAADPRHPDQAEWAALTARQGFMALAEALVDDFIVCAVMEPLAGNRQIVKLSYERPFDIESQRFLAWRWTRLEFDAPQSRLADSYHFELAAPTDMEAGFGALHFEPLAGSQDAMPEDDTDEPQGQRVHLYVSNVPSGVDARAYISLRARREGNLRAAVLTGLLSTALLWAGYLDLDDIADEQQSQVAAALLLLGPTLLAAALVRPGEHHLVTRVFWWVRVLTAGCMLSMLVAVGVLAGAGAEARDWIWLGAATVCSVCAALLLVAFWAPRMP